MSGQVPVANPILHHSLSSKNVVDHSPRSMSSKLMSATNADKVSDTSSPNKLQYGHKGQPLQVGPYQGPLSPKTEGETHPKVHSLTATKHQRSEQKTDGGYHGGESTTDAASAGALEADRQSRISNAFGAAHQYDWSEVAYLFD